MKKFIGILAVVSLCICMLVPAAFAANTDSLSSLLDGLDANKIANLSDDELSQLLGDSGLNLENFNIDTDAIKSALDSGIEGGKVDGVKDALSNLGNLSADNTAADTLTVGLDDLSDALGGMDTAWITDAFSNPDAVSSVTDMLGGAADGFDLTAIMDMISGAFAGGGLDLASLTGGMDLGSFDIGSILGGLGGSAGSTDMMSGIMDALMGGLSSLGLDPSMLDGLMDNEIIDFFANMFIGLGDIVNPGGSSSGSDSSASTTAPTTASTTASTTKPAVVTTSTPKTGDTSAVLAAVASLGVASAAAFVCLKKKGN